MSLPQPQAYKPSPLSIGSPRTSPFRRPESPASQSYRASSPGASPSSRPITPTTSPTKPHQPVLTSPSKLQNASTPFASTGGDAPSSPSWTPRGLTPSTTAHRTPSQSPTRSSSSSLATAVPAAAPVAASPQPPAAAAQPPAPLFSPKSTATSKDYANTTTPSSSAAISSLPAPLLHQLRQTFSLLDRSSTGHITRADVSAQLADLGLPSSSSDITPFFPPGAPQTLPLAQFLGQLAGVLTQFSGQEELLNAFGAFDERDCGEVEWVGLRHSVVNTGVGGGGESLSEREVNEAVEGFVGRKAFGKGGAGERGEVFRYRQWVGGVLGGGEEEKGALA